MLLPEVTCYGIHNQQWLCFIRCTKTTGKAAALIWQELLESVHVKAGCYVDATLPGSNTEKPGKFAGLGS